MAAVAEVSPSTVGRIWRTFGLKPHMVEGFTVSSPKFPSGIWRYMPVQIECAFSLKLATREEDTQTLRLMR